ncbi:MAG: hypothetical protein ABIA04_11790 [Pseudomonadota bacterium]
MKRNRKYQLIYICTFFILSTNLFSEETKGYSLDTFKILREIVTLNGHKTVDDVEANVLYLSISGLYSQAEAEEVRDLFESLKPLFERNFSKLEKMVFEIEAMAIAQDLQISSTLREANGAINARIFQKDASVHELRLASHILFALLQNEFISFDGYLQYSFDLLSRLDINNYSGFLFMLARAVDNDLDKYKKALVKIENNRVLDPLIKRQLRAIFIGNFGCMGKNLSFIREIARDLVKTMIFSTRDIYYFDKEFEFVLDDRLKKSSLFKPTNENKFFKANAIEIQQMLAMYAFHGTAALIAMFDAMDVVYYEASDPITHPAIIRMLLLRMVLERQGNLEESNFEMSLSVKYPVMNQKCINLF